jgi:uncharacterized protein (DUF488 family)
MTLFTIGHSNHPLDRFVSSVEAFEVRCIADVRAFPSSRRWPHFNREPLAAALSVAGVRYEWLPALGGRRRQRRPDSPHLAWTVPAFRNYADYADTAEFARGLEQLLTVSESTRTAFMCAEAKYWECHRRLIADRLVVAGHRVLHIETEKRAREHALPDFARVVEGRIVYDGATQLELTPPK